MTPPKSRKHRHIPIWAFIAVPAVAFASAFSSIEDTYKDGVRTEEIKVARLENIEQITSAPKTPEARPDFKWVKTTGVDGTTTWKKVPYDEMETL